MKRLLWLTDIHLNFLNQTVGILDFYDKIHKSNSDFILICGDIGEGDTVHIYLKKIGKKFPKLPVYFVLGNHDFYSNSFKLVYKNIRNLCNKSRNLRWLSDCEIIELSNSSALIGHDGWYDGALGDYFSSNVTLADFNMIQEFVGLNKNERLILMKNLASKATEKIIRNIETALERYDNIIIGTHVPPFRESCWYDGKISDDNYLPFFSCKMLGDALLEVMKKYFNSNKQVIVLCGHSHGASIYKPLENLEVICGEAKYGTTIRQEIIRIK